jgi:hypothetical protein
MRARTRVRHRWRSKPAEAARSTKRQRASTRSLEPPTQTSNQQSNPACWRKVICCLFLFNFAARRFARRASTLPLAWSGRVRECPTRSSRSRRAWAAPLEARHSWRWLAAGPYSGASVALRRALHPPGSARGATALGVKKSVDFGLRLRLKRRETAPKPDPRRFGPRWPPSPSPFGAERLHSAPSLPGPTTRARKRAPRRGTE